MVSAFVKFILAHMYVYYFIKHCSGMASAMVLHSCEKFLPYLSYYHRVWLAMIQSDTMKTSSTVPGQIVIKVSTSILVPRKNWVTKKLN